MRMRNAYRQNWMRPYRCHGNTGGRGALIANESTARLRENTNFVASHIIIRCNDTNQQFFLLPRLAKIILYEYTLNHPLWQLQ